MCLRVGLVACPRGASTLARDPSAMLAKASRRNDSAAAANVPVGGSKACPVMQWALAVPKQAPGALLACWADRQAGACVCPGKQHTGRWSAHVLAIALCPGLCPFSSENPPAFEDEVHVNGAALLFVPLPH